MNTKKKNHIIDNHGDYLEIDISTPKNPEAVMLIDCADWERFKTLNYGRVYASRMGSNDLYAFSHKSRNVIHAIHRIVLPNSVVVDHINHNCLDNRMCNIRGCTYLENNWNRKIQSNNTTGYRGVHWKSSHNKYVAAISVMGKIKHLGLFETAEEASLAYNDAAISLHGEYFNNSGVA